MSVAALNGISIAYDDVGSGDAIVLVHGHPFDRSMWTPQRDALRDAGWRVIVPDLRGYGETSVVPGKTTLDVFARDIAALLDHLRVERVVIGGLSMGGQIVMEFCRLHPHRVRAVLLAATSPMPDTDEGARSRRLMADRLVANGMTGYADEVLSKMLAPANVAALPSVAAHVHAMMRGAPTEGAAAALRGRAERQSYEPTLAALDVPALIVVGDQDPYTPLAEAERMHALIAGSSLVCMDGVGHMPNLERTAEFNAALLRFLSRLG
jgi:pimeloyl-ACP methyl ester carboxylesterase